MPTRYDTGLYGRTSKDDPKTVTIEIQQKTLRHWAQVDPQVSHVHEEYWDDGVSGKIPLAERPAGQRLMADVASGKIKCVAVAYSDRFGRTLLDGLKAVEELETAGVMLVAVNDGWDARRQDSPLYFQFRMMLAEEDHRRIVGRLTAGKARAMDRDNAPPGGPLTYGYRMDERGHYVIDPVEAAIVIRIFEMALAGSSSAEILAWVISSAAPAAGRKFQKRQTGSKPAVCAKHEAAQWHLTKVGKILRNETYTGVRRWAGREFPCPALIHRPDFERMQLLLADKSLRYGGKKGDPTKGLVSGLLNCAGCGEPFYRRPNTIRRANGKVDVYQMYVCDGMRRKTHPCYAKMLPIDSVDRRVWEKVKEYVADPEAMVRKVLAADNACGLDLAQLDQQERGHEDALRAIDAEVAEVWEEQKANGWPMKWVRTRLNELAGRRAAVEALVAGLRERRAAACLDRDSFASVTAHLAHIRAFLRPGYDPTAEAKYDIIRKMVVGGTITTHGNGYGKTASIELQFVMGERLIEHLAGRGGESRQVPKQWSYGSERDTTCHVLHVQLQ